MGNSSAGPLGESLQDLALDVLELGRGRLERLALLLEELAALTHFRQQEPELPDVAAIDVVEIQVLLDVREREPETLAAQDEHEPAAIAPRVHARGAGAQREDEAFLFV